jgi:hypothetical protein
MQTQHKVRLPSNPAKDRQFERLLRRAAKLLQGPRHSPGEAVRGKRSSKA